MDLKSVCIGYLMYETIYFYRHQQLFTVTKDILEGISIFLLCLEKRLQDLQI